MDELLHHCLRELAFDGDLGCDVSRLSDFVKDFYSHSSQTAHQKVDDAFCAFVWSLVVEQPTVLVGTIPLGITSEVWIAPQVSAKRKANARGEEHVLTEPPALDLVPDAKSRPLIDLQAEYGNKLRIAGDRDAIYAAITGTHIRFPKMSPMVYTALQIITRGRYDGVTVVQLGQQTKYDQKTCFYLVKQLTDLNLVVKVRRGGVGTHFVIHRYFFERSDSWKAIREEELRAELAARETATNTEIPEEEGETLTAASLGFTPIDARHLSSLPLVRGRVVKLLKASANNIHVATNMLITIGFQHPTKTDRRFFQRRIQEMIHQGVVEKVVVPSKKKRSGATVLCLRLVNESAGEGDGAVVVPPMDEEEDQDHTEDDINLGGFKLNMTLHKQISDLLEEAGTNGMTLTELSSSLCQFDRRTIELILTRAERFQPPAHLGDIGVAALLENSGRERRHRYFTVSAYRTLVEQENLDKSNAGYSDVDLNDVGGFSRMEPIAFYTNEDELHQYQDSFKDDHPAKIAKLAKKTAGTAAGGSGSVKSKRSKKKQAGEGEGGTEAQGSTSTPAKLSRHGKRKAENEPTAGGAEDPAESISRPPKRRKTENTEAIEGPAPSPPEPKKRGRPKKSVDPDAPPPVPKKRGRPPKLRSEGEDVAENAPPKKRGRKSLKSASIVAGDNDNDDYVDDAGLEPGALRRSQRSSMRKISFDFKDGDNGERNEEDEEMVDELAGDQEEVNGKEREGEANLSGLAGIADGAPKPQSQPLANGVPVEASMHVTLGGETEASGSMIVEDRGVSSQARVAGPLNTGEDGGTSPHSNLSDLEDHSAAYAQARTPSIGVVTAPKQSADILIVEDDSASLATPSGIATGEDQNASRVGASNVQAEPLPAPQNEVMSLPLPLTGAAASASQVVSTSKSAPRPKVNVSNLRRENELLRCVEMLGGIVNIQTKEIYDTHAALLETLAKAGEPASSPPGTRTDKRTVTSMFNSMESRGKVKQLTTSIPMYLGTSRQTVIVYLPHITDEQLSVYLSNLTQNSGPPPPQPSGRVIEEAVGYGQVSRRAAVRKPAPVKKLDVESPERWQKNTERAVELFSREESAIRDVLLTERTTLCQAYHTIIAKCIRARELHLICLHAFETAYPSPQIVSHQQKILHLSFLALDLPLGQYCKLVSPTSHSEVLSEFMATPEALDTLIRNLPANIKAILQVEKSRPSAKLLDSLEVLRGLGLATPIISSDSDSPLFACEAKDKHPTAYDAAPLTGWSPHTPSSAPTYWKFHDAAPVHHWAKSPTDPPFLQDVLVGSVPLAVAYWNLLENACLNQSLEPPNQAISQTAPLNISLSAARTLRRRVSWGDHYKLSWYQTQYLKRFYDIASGSTPLQDEDSDAIIARISWVISAPSEAVREYYRDIQNKLNKEADKARRRLKREAKGQEAAEAAEAQASLRKKAEDARRQREYEWIQLLQRIHPEPLKKSASLRVKQIHDRFIESATVQDTGRWEMEIAATIHEAEIISKKVLKTKKAPRKTAAITLPSVAKPAEPLSTVAPPVAMNPPERSVAELIAEQGPPLDQTRLPRKQRKKPSKDDLSEHNANKPRPITRRPRFTWTREYEELARDAAAIIRARCRDAIRLDWGAFEQVFPAVPRNTVRQRVAHLREATGGDTYLNRLEDTWHHLWVQHRGSLHLPDEDPLSATNFDLVGHIEFLRKHVDKNALRVGYLPTQQSTQPIPNSVSSIFEQFDVVESSSSAPSWDFVWNVLVEEGRERGMLSLPFTSQLDVLPLEETPAEDMCLAEAALKMVLGTPNEVYEPEVASALLTSVGEDKVPFAATNLLGRGILSKLVRDPQKSQPGRLLKISEVNQNALNGVVNRDTFQDAAALEELSAQQEDDWREWPLLASDGDMATLLQLVSDDKVEFNVDTSHPQSCRVALDWNSKKADDDQIETAINFRFLGLTDSASGFNDTDTEHNPVDVVEDPAIRHSMTVDGQPACCRKNILGAVIDCSGCLDELWRAHSLQFNAEELDTAQLILWLVGQAGAKGLSKQGLIVKSNMSPEHILPVVFKMTRESHPFLHWVGYNSTLLVSSAHARSWTVALSASPVIRVFPRRWLDIFGKKVMDVWEAALHAVVGAILFRPGISQTELRWRLKTVYDKQEVAELLRTLLEVNFLRNHFVDSQCAMGVIEPHIISALDETEEGRVFWFVNEMKHWYAI